MHNERYHKQVKRKVIQQMYIFAVKVELEKTTNQQEEKRKKITRGKSGQRIIVDCKRKTNKQENMLNFIYN